MSPVAERLRTQAGWCRELGSPLYGRLLCEAAEDVERGGPLRRLLAPHAGNPGRSALALRLMGAVHRLVLEGRLPDLARCYPSAGGDSEEDPRPAFRGALLSHGAEIGALLARPVQTNEVARSAALLGGFLEAGRAFGLPLRVLELGASAGLNLRWDHYHYRAGTREWGDPGSPVDLGDPFAGTAPPLDTAVEVVERRGCDRAPLDATTPDGELTLLSYVWADQLERIRRLKGAAEVARRVPAAVDKEDAGAWLESSDLHREGAATVVFHSIVLQY
ncbi:MAG: DUF2332 domain-containing protein, partial [Candidatus Dormibacterales bacterium]